METIRSVTNTISEAASSAFQSSYDVARKGFGEGTNEHYDRARPSYPAESLQNIHKSLSPTALSRPEGLNIIELGSGTGLFSRILLAPPSSEYPTWNIHSLYAVEPSEGMRTQWTKKYDGLVESGDFDPGRVVNGGEVQTLNGGFTDLSGLKSRLRERGEEEQWADLVVMAQAWHWAHPDYDAAIKEIASIMKPDGVLVFIWNNENRDPPYPQDLRTFEMSLEAGTPQQHRGLWEATFEAPSYTANFREERGDRNIVHWKSVHDDRKRIDRVLSKSYVASRSETEKEDIIAKIKEIQTTDDGKEWIDREAGTYYQPWWTLVVAMHRK
ncbi:S-adenosyl-L-methionine-dependent methyltransferase [Filobasidium floriforme]|uniref:S-adenosyl-L-methionine-dependent methyltransferase n=1 Tax=Filobasidium floriforme TaxID=5210 RepID=UPI001E8DE96F|nr:S-adenosyl-L-methionine-dependent methyltransferase [Filobasidium floriforme]KAH8078879.1 S-adenosyl-L-methionine-dependent methyltransferase [Filobasidium floriforme]